MRSGGTGGWLFPLVIVLGIGAGAYSALTGRRLGFSRGWSSNPTNVKIGGLVAIVIGVGLLIYWFAALRPA